MRLCACFVFVIVGALLAGCGVGDQITLVDGPQPAAPTPPPAPGETLDGEFAAALASAGVTAIPRPPSEDPALVALGRALFFDKELSGNRTISCATCHHPVAGTGDALPVSLGEGALGLGANRQPGTGVLIPRNAPHVFNAGVQGADTMFWDSRVRRDPVSGWLQTPEPALNGAAPPLPDHALPLSSSLAAQAMFPVTSPDEMRGQPGSNPDVADAPDNEGVWRALMLRLVGTDAGGGGFAGYRALFAAAYPSVVGVDALTFGHAARAIAAYEREAFTALGTPLDRYLGGDATALSDTEKRGGLLFFGPARCGECHNGPLLTDLEHHAMCVPQLGPGKEMPFEDLGLSLLTLDPADDYKFRTPGLRNVALTGPWMHDGAFTTLEAAVRHQLDPAGSLAAYDPGQLPPLFAATLDGDPTRRDARVAALDPAMGGAVALTDDEFDALLAFLHALTDPSSLSLLHEIPGTVPSGLPVAD